MYIIHPIETSLGYYASVQDIVAKFKAYTRLNRIRKTANNRISGKVFAS